MGNESKIADIRERLSAAFEGGADDDEGSGNVTSLKTEFPLALRMLEALLFASSEPLDEATLKDRLPTDIELEPLIAELQKRYEGRGVNLIRIGGRWQFRTAPDLAFLMEKERIEPRRLSRAAIETLAIIAYHQPITRLEIEEIRGVSIAKGTLDVLLETGWVRLRGRRRTPGRPICYGTSQAFLEHFGLETVKDLPGLEELKAAGLLSSKIPPGFTVPTPDEEDAELDPVGEDEAETLPAEEEDAAPAAEVEVDAEVEVETEVVAQADPEAETEPEAEPESEMEAEPESDVEAEAESEPEQGQA